MIKTLEIKNFKSIKHLKLDCKRVNIFIGEPNTGKSNLLESLGLFSFGSYSLNRKLKDFVRYETTSNLFYDGEVGEAVEIRADGLSLSIELGKMGSFLGQVRVLASNLEVCRMSGTNELNYVGGNPEPLSAFKFYRFAAQEIYSSPESEFLLPPFGSNMCWLLYRRKEIMSVVGNLFPPTGLKLGLRPQEYRLELRKEMDHVTIAHPYSLASETLQRLVFYLAAIMSNKDSVLAFEEPEAHAFPYHTKYLAEVIALDENNNQYFISTHNPYFLEPVLEKTPKDQIGIFITYFRDYQTKVKLLSEKEMEEITEVDVFLNLDRFIEA